MVGAALHSSFWYRVAALRPQLAAQVRVDRQFSRGQRWYVLVDAASSQSYRLNDSAYAFVGCCNGERSVQQVWAALAARDAASVPRQDEIIDLLTRLHERSLLRFDQAPDFGRSDEQHGEQRRRQRWRWLNPLALRLPLGNPGRLLRQLDPWADRLFRVPLLWLWLAGVLLAAGAALANAAALHAHALKWLDSPRYLWLVWLVYPLIKLVHELAHGLALRRWRGDVPQAGITLLVLMPVPFVDASAAAGFRHKGQRVVVSAAGIMAELAVAAAALGVWLAVQPGVVRDLAFVALFIGGVSTLLFNANPLLRFDGYFVLTDALDLPNLAPRSQRYWAELLRRRVLGIATAAALVPAPGERPWLLAYAPLSWTFRVAISIAIVLWLGGVSVVLGSVVGLALLVALIAVPARALGRLLTGRGVPERQRRRAFGGAATAVAALALAILVVPLPAATIAQGVLWPPEQTQIRVGSDGFIAAFHVADGARVEAGDNLVSLRSPRLESERLRLVAHIAALDAEMFSLLGADPAAARDVSEDLDRTRAELARVDEKLAGLEVRAQVAGTVSLPRQADLIAGFVHEGTLLGHVLTGEAATVRVAVAHEEADRLRAGTRAVTVRLSEAPQAELEARMSRDLVGAGERLPSAALGTGSGGSIVTDPQDSQGLKPAAPVVLLDLSLPGYVPPRLGARVWVRFEHVPASLAAQVARQVRQLLLRRFNPTD